MSAGNANAAAARVLPPPLRPGDAIGVCCPAGPPRDPAALHEGLRLIQEAGFRVRCDFDLPALRALLAHMLGEAGFRVPEPGLLAGRPDAYLADEDEARARTLRRLLEDDDIRAVMAARGGYGCLRLVPHLDADLFVRHPKWLVGFSDLTLLLNHVSAVTGLVTLHGPMVSSLARCRAEDRRFLFSYLAHDFPESLPLPGLRILRPGRADEARGRLAGGNLATLIHALATPWDHPWDDGILFLEDTGEWLYRLDRFLTQLREAGRFARLRGLILGDFDAGRGHEAVDRELTEQVWARVLEVTPPDLPVWANVPFGHCRRNLPLPVGMTVRMDAERGRLVLLP